MNDKMMNFGDIVYSCFIPHDFHWEHRMPLHSVVFVRSGMMVVCEDGEETEVKAGNYVFLKRDCRVNIKKTAVGETPYSGVVVMLSRRVLKDFYSRMPSGKADARGVRPIRRVATFLPRTVSLQGLFNSLLPYVDHEEKPTEELLALKIQETVLCLLAIDRSFYPTLFDFNEAWKIDLMDFMERNYTEDLTLEEFASYTGRSLATFKRDFAKLSDIPPQRWIMEHRLEKAKSLLLAGDGVSAQEVAYMAGFKNRSHFSQAFKKRYGVAPNNYLKLNGKGGL